MKKIIIIGATSGIGREMAIRYAALGRQVGITGRRTELLENIQQQYPTNIFIKTMDICQDKATEDLQALIDEMNGVDTIFINSGYGKESFPLDASAEMQTVATNALGFTNMIIFAYNYFRTQPKGHIVVTSSVASVRALRQSPAYSATKRYMRHYVDCLAQLAHHEKLSIRFTTLIPGFISTEFLREGNNYPLVISLDKACNTIFKAIEKKKRAVYLPFRWNFVVALWCLIPKWIWERYC